MRNSLRLPAILLLALALAGLLPPRAQAAGLPPQQENRFLFVIDTASAMRRSSNGVAQAVQELLHSGMQGQLQDGDTIGLWTYDDTLHSEFPMQVWKTNGASKIEDRFMFAVHSLHFQKRAHLDKVMPVVRQVAEASRVLTVIFVFDGSEEMSGTGFDTALNDLHREFRKQMQEDHVPFVTVLAAKDGKFFQYSVSVPGSIALPKTVGLVARSPKPAATNALSAVADLKPVPAPAAPRAPEHHIELILTNATPAPVPVAVVPTAPPQSSPPVVAVPNNPQSTVAPTSLPENVVNNSEPATTPTPIVPTTPAPTPVTAPTKPSAVVDSAAPPPAPSSPMPEVKPVPVVAQTLVALPSPQDHFALLVIAISLLTIAVVLVLFLVRRSRSAGSLISQSMDRTR